MIFLFLNFFYFYKNNNDIKNSIAVWDFTLPGDFGDKETLNNWLRENAKMDIST